MGEIWLLIKHKYLIALFKKFIDRSKGKIRSMLFRLKLRVK